MRICFPLAFSPTDAVTATRNAAGMVTVDVNGNVADDYMDVDGETIAGSGDWNGVTMTSGTNTLVVYTDIEAPSDVLLQRRQYARDAPGQLRSVRRSSREGDV